VPTDSSPTHFDVLIIGAGLSGISAAFHIQRELPNHTYTILEGRERLGGTWDLFQYPGIRSDSDMFTLGYSFRPWTDSKSIADGPAILKYVRETAESHGIDRKIRFSHRVEAARWSSETSLWTLEVRNTVTDEVRTFTCNFVFSCSGYYDYKEGFTPEFAGRERFQGRVVHPQQWTPDVEYEGKRVVVIGSGATAVTLVPELAKRAAHVTMLQRSPTYVVSMPERDAIANWIRSWAPSSVAYDIARWKNVVFGMAFYHFCRRFPERAKKFLVGQVRTLVGDEQARHFTPSYNPWDQRVCLVPDGDLFETLRAGKASVVTDTIETFTETGLRLKSGTDLPADLVVTATGLKLKFVGGVVLDVDGQTIDSSKLLAYKGMMFTGIPNFAVAIGYTNASWTLKCDLTSEYVCRLLKHMKLKGYTQCVPHNNDPAMPQEPLLDFQAGYVLRSIQQFPRQGSRAPWKLHQNYALDRMVLRHSAIEDGSMQFSTARKS
jgi:monooxygenase